VQGVSKCILYDRIGDPKESREEVSPSLFTGKCNVCPSSDGYSPGREQGNELFYLHPVWGFMVTPVGISVLAWVMAKGPHEIVYQFFLPSCQFGKGARTIMNPSFVKA